MAKTKCPITHAAFVEKGPKALPTVIINGHSMDCKAKDPDPAKSLGWFTFGKSYVEIDGVKHAVQFSGNVTLVGSKPE